MEQEQNKTPEKPTEWKFYRKVTAEDEALIAAHLQEHPTITREEVLRELEYAGY